MTMPMLIAACGPDAGRVDAQLSDSTVPVADTAEVQDTLLDLRPETTPVETERGDDVSTALADLTACTVVASDRVPLPEASGAALVDAAGTRILLVADSGNAGQALLIDVQSDQSDQPVPAMLPLGLGAGDDIEGLERAPDGRIFGLSSAGFLRAWRVDDDGFALVLGPVALSDDPAWVCEPFGVNCGANFEGLCLHPAPEVGACAGWAASKATGELVCLVPSGQGYRLDASRRIAITEPERISGCAFEPIAPHRLVVAGNLFSGSALWEVTASGEAREFQERGAGNQEAVVVLAGGRLQSYGDGQDLLAGESPRVRFECR